MELSRLAWLYAIKQYIQLCEAAEFHSNTYAHCMPLALSIKYLLPACMHTCIHAESRIRRVLPCSVVCSYCTQCCRAYIYSQHYLCPTVVQRLWLYVHRDSAASVFCTSELRQLVYHCLLLVQARAQRHDKDHQTTANHNKKSRMPIKRSIVTADCHNTTGGGTG